jgi:hypothetical protein
MSKARTLANLISDNAELADGQISVAEVVGAAPLASPTFTGTASGTFSGPLTGNVTGNLTGNVTGAVTGDVTAPEIDLTAIAKDISDTAVDVFVYDTSKDSDGGAWRKRTQHTSWYNETLNTATRGSRKEFPAVAVIVAEIRTVTIYDGDDPDLPMWMEFPNSGAGKNLINTGDSRNWTSVSMLNGILCVGMGYGTTAGMGLDTADFITDSGYRYRNGTGGTNYRGQFGGNIAQRRTSVYNGLEPRGLLVGETVNDVAMTVLPNAPIDGATGLPAVTTAVATNSGVSVIKDDGTVVSGHTGVDAEHIMLHESGALVYGVTGAGNDNFSLHLDSGNTTRDTFYDNRTAEGVYDTYLNEGSGECLFKGNKFDLALAQTKGLLQITEEPDFSTGLHNRITSTYNTGHMVGDIKLATLSDTDDTDVTGSELVTNGTFAGNLNNWDNNSSGTGSVVYDSGTGAAKFTRVDGNNNGLLAQGMSLVSGQKYVLSFDVATGTTTNVQIRGYISSTNTTGTVLENSFAVSAGNSYGITFIAPSGEDGLEFRGITGTNTVLYLDNISLRLAEEDRSVNGNGLQVFGTVTKNPVATGADLVAYSGFSASNYLEQPYTSDLDFGTGDCCGMAWFKQDATALTRTIFDRDSVATDKAISFEIQANTSYLQISLDDGTDRVYVNSGSTVDDDSWHLGVWVRRGDTLEIYVDGVLKNTADASSVDSISSTDARLRVGSYRRSGISLPFGGSLALIRISATAPSAEQIAKIYEDEKVLFQDGAQATLYGSSDAVTALAYDDTTELLHAGTSAGRSVFQGLRRVDNTTDAVGAAISASNGLVAED